MKESERIENKLKVNKRQHYPDIVKAVAIILVVFGHNIQFGSGIDYYENREYFWDSVFRFIYAFHMPLFMLVSGYFFANSVKKYGTRDLILNRLKALFVPILMWSAIPVGLLFMKSIIRREFDTGILWQIINTVLHNFWFLWAILFCSVGTLMISRKFKDFLWSYASVLIILILLPDVLNTHYYKFMYPYFVVGYFWNKENMFGKYKKYLSKCKWLIFAVITITFGSLYYFYGYESYIYISRICIWKMGWKQQFAIDVFRWLIGFVGSAMVLWGVYIVVENRNNRIINLLTKLGECSMGIYILDDLLNRYVLLRVTRSISGLNYGFTVIETIVVLTVCYGLTKGIKKIPYLNRMLLGSR